MFGMFRVATFLLMFSAGAAFAQTPPPGPPFDPGKHPNPIVTYVETKDFRPLSPDKVKTEAGIDLLGFGQDEARQESLEIADGRYVKSMTILNFRTEVTFYPVVRQQFKMADDGAAVVMYSFRFPKVDLPRDFAQIVLNEASIEKKRKPADMRFGGQNAEMLSIRGAPALYFEKDGQITVYWQEDGVAHTVTANLPRNDLFGIIEDLL